MEVLTEGAYWIRFNREVRYYNITQPVAVTPELDLMIEDYLLRKLLSIAEIADHELGLEMREGIFTRVLEPGKVAYWDMGSIYEVRKVNLNEVEVPPEIPKQILMKAPVLQRLKIFPVEAGQKGLLFVDGDFVRMLDPGAYYFWKTEKVVAVKTVDTRVQSMPVSGQEILTKDKAGIRLNFSAQYQVLDIQLAMVETKSFAEQLYEGIQLVLREYVGGMTLDQLLANKQAVGPYILQAMAEPAAKLGVKLISGGIKDIILPGDVKDIMNQVLIAQKKAQANTIMRQEETASTRSLLNTAKLMEQNAMLLKLKEMEYMEKIAEKIGEITVNGGSQVMDQLRELVVAK